MASVVSTIVLSHQGSGDGGGDSGDDSGDDDGEDRAEAESLTDDFLAKNHTGFSLRRPDRYIFNHPVRSLGNSKDETVSTFPAPAAGINYILSLQASAAASALGAGE